jgi:hypothetical protein
LLAVIVALVLLALWVSFLYTLSWRARLGNSDNANAVLAGHEMIRGNILLRGWILPADTYWSIDLPVFGLFTAVAGVGPAAMYGVPLLLATAVILVGARLAGRGRPPAPGWIGAGVVFVLLGLPHPLLTTFLLQVPQHIGTTLFCLIAFGLLGRAPGTRGWWLGVTLLAVAVLGDPFALAIGVAPVVAAGLIGAFRRRRWEPALASGTVAFLAVGGAKLARLALDHAGAHGLSPAPPLSPWRNWRNNLRFLLSLLSSLLGAGPDGGLAGPFRHAHLLGLAAVVAAIITTVALVLIGVVRRPHAGAAVSSGWDPGRPGVGQGPHVPEEPGLPPRRNQRFRRGPPGAPDGAAKPPEARSWLDDVLLMACGAGLAAYVLVTLPSDHVGVNSTRYLLPSLMYAAVLTGRRTGDLAERLPRRRRAVLTAALVTLGTVYLAASISGMGRPRPADPAGEVVQWLAANHLSAGFGPYWSASIMTVKSRGAVTVRPVQAVEGRLHGRRHYASVDWFRTDGRTPRRFVVYPPGDPGLGGVDDYSAEATFGPPARAARVGPYRILIWDKDLSGELGPPS